MKATRERLETIARLIGALVFLTVAIWFRIGSLVPSWREQCEANAAEAEKELAELFTPAHMKEMQIALGQLGNMHM